MKTYYRHIGLCLGLVAAFGCASMPPTSSSSKPGKVPGRIVENETPKPVFERLAQATDLQTQDFTKGHSVTYHRNHGSIGTFGSVSKDERDLYVLEGAPDFSRSFKTNRGIEVNEWIYEKKDIQIQFKGGELAYCAPISEQVKAILDFGQPSKIWTQLMAGGQQKEMFWYQSKFRMMVFARGKLIGTQ